jgi:RNA polymerase sigma-70 factor (ECF subfamily)
VTENAVAEDLTEVVFLRAFEALGRYKERGRPFSAYLYQIARNLLVDHYRQQKEEVSLEVADRIVAETDQVDEQVIQRERLEQIERVLADLRPDYQEVIRLRVVLALPTVTTADWMGRSEGAVRVLLYRALKELRERLVREDEKRQSALMA